MGEAIQVALQDETLVRDELMSRMRQLNLTAAEIARLTGKSTTTISLVMNGKYKGRAEVLAEIMEALDEAEKRQNESARPTSFFSEGQTIIYSILNLTYHHRGFSTIVGPSGMGKTFTAKRFAEQHALDVMYIRCCDGMTVIDTIQLLLDMTSTSNSGNRVQRMRRAINGFKKRGVRMILVDEADLLVTDSGNKPAILKKIALFREVKEAGVGVAMIGLESFDDTLRSVGETYLTSRIDYFRRVSDPSIEELSNFLEGQGWDISEPDARQVIAMAPKRGGFRFLEKLSQTGKFLGLLADALSVSYAAGGHYKEGKA
jgi:DNA transposition AAA+ family ATPase